MAGGRPTEYKPEYCEAIIELMRDGRSIYEVAAELGVAKKTLYNWADAHEEFLHAKRLGEELSQAWWERQGRENLINRYQSDSLNASLWYMNMKNRFGWRDKIEQETTGKDGGPIQHEDVTRPKMTKAEWMKLYASSSGMGASGRPSDDSDSR